MVLPDVRDELTDGLRGREPGEAGVAWVAAPVSSFCSVETTILARITGRR